MWKGGPNSRNTESFQRPPILKREILEQEITCTLMKT